MHMYPLCWPSKLTLSPRSVILRGVLGECVRQKYVSMPPCTGMGTVLPGSSVLEVGLLVYTWPPACSRLHEEEKTGTRICQKLKQSSLPSPPSPPSELPSPSVTAVEKMFGGKIVTRICCLQCLNISSREEAFTDLSLAFPPPERSRQRRMGSVMLPMEDVQAQELALAPRVPGVQRQRKHCITGDAPRAGLDIEGVGTVGTGRQSGQEEKVEREQAGKEKEVSEEEKEGAREEEKEEGEEKEKKEDEKEAENGKEKEGDILGSGTHREAATSPREQACGPEGSRSVLDLVNYFLSPERLTAENRYYCESCASLQDAEKVVELSQGPRYLILTLLRFSFDLRTMRRRKILDDVTIPLLLRLPLAGGQGQAYDLCSVVVHSGVSSESGHYYCYAREGAARPAPVLGSTDRPEPENQWYLFNDTRVSFSSFESVSNVTSFFPKDTAYVLFYRQRPREGPEAEPGSPRVRAEPTLHKDLMEAISKDNVLYLQVSPLLRVTLWYRMPILGKELAQHSHLCRTVTCSHFESALAFNPSTHSSLSRGY